MKWICSNQKNLMILAAWTSTLDLAPNLNSRCNSSLSKIMVSILDKVTKVSRGLHKITWVVKDSNQTQVDSCQTSRACNSQVWAWTRIKASWEAIISCKISKWDRTLVWWVAWVNSSNRCTKDRWISLAEWIWVVSNKTQVWCKIWTNRINRAILALWDEF